MTIRWLLLALAAATVPHVLRIPSWLSVALVVLGIWVWRAAVRRKHVHQLVRVSLLVLMFAGLFVSRSPSLGLDAAAPYFIGYLWLKLLEIDTPRDVAVTGFFGVFLAALPLLEYPGLILTLASVTFAILFIAAIIRHQAGAGWRLPITASAQLFAIALPFAAVFFLVIPRPDLPSDLVGGGLGQARTGLSDTMRPGDIAKLVDDDRVVFRAEGRPPAGEPLYWRVHTLSTIAGNAWKKRSGDAQMIRESAPIARQADARRSPWQLEITCSAHGAGWLPTPEMPIDVPIGVGQTPSGGLIVGQALSSPIVYRVTCDASARPNDSGPTWLRAALEVPQVDPAVERIASDIAAQAGIDLTRSSEFVRPSAQRIAAWNSAVDALRERFARGGYRYTREPGTMAGDQLRDFLIDKKAGFCAHYATASATLFRLMGMPARVVSGFLGAELNETNGMLTVRNRHAHAWTEVWLGPARGWERFDAVSYLSPDEAVAAGTRNDGVALPPPPGNGVVSHTWRSIKQWWDLVDARYTRLLMAYDAEQQGSLLARLHLRGATGIAIAVVVPTLVLLAIIFTVRWWLRRLPAPERAWRRLEARLAHSAAGPRAMSEGIIAYAQRATLSLPDAVRESVLAAAQAQSTWRYGRETSPEPALVAIRSALRVVTT